MLVKKVYFLGQPPLKIENLQKSMKTSNQMEHLRNKIWNIKDVGGELEGENEREKEGACVIGV